MEGASVCVSFDYLDNPSSGGPTEVQFWVWSCLDERFSRKLHAAICMKHSDSLIIISIQQTWYIMNKLDCVLV